MNLTSFNTSHVVVYQGKDYIFIKDMLFQYISCCSLSIGARGIGKTYSRFNTSHVVVYPDSQNFLKRTETSFNTSHVVVYHKKLEMEYKGNHLFQYISCCSLSHIYMRFVINCFLIFH